MHRVARSPRDSIHHIFKCINILIGARPTFRKKLSKSLCPLLFAIDAFGNKFSTVSKSKSLISNSARIQVYAIVTIDFQLVPVVHGRGPRHWTISSASIPLAGKLFERLLPQNVMINKGLKNQTQLLDTFFVNNFLNNCT